MINKLLDTYEQPEEFKRILQEVLTLSYAQGRADMFEGVVKMIKKRIELQKKFLPSSYETAYGHALEDVLQALIALQKVEGKE